MLGRQTARQATFAGAGALALALVLGAPASAPAQQAPAPSAGQAAMQVTGAPGATAIERGKYLVYAGDCAACHTANGHPMFSGGRYMPTPFGPISTSNITPDKQTGIGNWTDDQFYRLFHAGIGKGGTYIYPVMPFPWYTKVTRQDALDIKAYLFSLAPVHAPRLPSHLAFPFNVRAGLAVWDAAFLKEGTFKPDPNQSAEVNRGAYLVLGLAHCGECHNGNNLLGDTQAAASLQGGPIQQWYAPNITSDQRTGIGRFSDADLYTYLKTGTDAAMGVVAGPMAETVHESLRNLSDADLHAIVAYLKSTPAKPSYQPVHKPEVVAATSAGTQTYLSYCASCHQLDGRGIKDEVPSLVANGAVIAKGSQDVIRAVLGGLEAKQSWAPMPGLGAVMSDQQIADVTNYVRQAWGNAAPPNAGAGDVGTLRADTHTLMNAERPGGCPSLAQPELARAVADKSTGIADLLQQTTLVNMIPNVDQILGKLKSAAPGVPQADIVNGLTIAYCPVVLADAATPAPQKAVRLDQFGERVYTQLLDNGKQ